MGCKNSKDAVSQPTKAAAGAPASTPAGPYTTEAMAKMPAWIQSGCGDTPYYCEEKNATFMGKEGKTPAEMPDLSKHASFMSDFLNAHPEVYD